MDTAPQSRSLSPAEARRIALAAQGFVRQGRERQAGWGKLNRALSQMHLLQLDSVNVVVRSHYLPLFARVGAYDRAAFDARTEGRRRATFEAWAHVASLLPLDLHPLVRWRHDRARAGSGIYPGMDRFAAEEGSYLARVLDHVRRHGPVATADVPDGGKAAGGWWGWSRGKLAVECLFDRGLLTTARRDGFDRIYDLPERVIPSDVLARPTPSEADAFRILTGMAGQALGVATAFDLRDYFRLPVDGAKRALDEAVEDGVLLPVTVRGWDRPAFLHRDAQLPRRAGGVALLSPFDPLVWDRDRTERIFGFRYRIEIYTPEAKRQYGYYVLPFLMGQDIVARVCLKADRAAGVLRANAAHLEPGRDAGAVAAAMSGELARMARWLGLGGVEAGPSGDLAPALAVELAAASAAANATEEPAIQSLALAQSGAGG
jgi:uncharacterized protein YcaQ